MFRLVVVRLFRVNDIAALVIVAAGITGSGVQRETVPAQTRYGNQIRIGSVGVEKIGIDGEGRLRKEAGGGDGAAGILLKDRRYAGLRIPSCGNRKTAGRQDLAAPAERFRGVISGEPQRGSVISAGGNLTRTDGVRKIHIVRNFRCFRGRMDNFRSQKIFRFIFPAAG